MQVSARAAAMALLAVALVAGLVHWAAGEEDDARRERDDRNDDKIQVALSAPASGALYAAPASVQLVAQASSRQKSHPIARVDFFAGTTLIGTVPGPSATGEYAFTWNGVAAGSYVVVARAVNDKGDRDVSAPVAITVDAPPSVAISGPAANTVFNAPATISVSANAADPDGTVAKVEFFQGSTLVGTAISAPYTINWTDVAPGGYVLTARATDNLGFSSISAPVNVIVNAAPTVSVASPTGGALFNAPSVIPLRAMATDADGSVVRVDFYQGQVLIGSASAAPFAFDWTDAAPGQYSITAVATDNFGASTTSAAVSVRVNAVPTVSLTSPSNGASFTAPANIAIGADAADVDGSIAKVEFFRGDTLITTLTAAPYTFTLTGVPAGSYVLTAVITDDVGAVTTSVPVTVTVKASVAQVYYIYTDHLNTPRLIEDQNRKAVWRWDQTEPFGSNLPDEDPQRSGLAFTCNLRFPGQYFDPEIGSHYNYFRDFDPSLGRYLESDPTGLQGGLNTYAYAKGSPVRYKDRYGLDTAGCDGVADTLENPCRLRCCAEHDECYDKFKCSKSSWVKKDGCVPGACAGCNRVARNCFIKCAYKSNHKASSPMYYCAEHHKYIQIPGDYATQEEAEAACEHDHSKDKMCCNP